MESVLNELARQIPTALLVGGLAIYLIRLFNQQAVERDQQNQQANLLRDESFRVALAAQLELMRKFWESQQESNREVMERLMRGMETLDARVRHHDEKFDLAVGTMFERTQEEPPEGLNIPTRPRRKPHGND